MCLGPRPQPLIPFALCLLVLLSYRTLSALQIPQQQTQPNSSKQLGLPLPLISAVVAALKAPSIIKAVPIFFQHITQEHKENSALPVAYRPFASLDFCQDCVSAQTHARQQSPPLPFLLELTPSNCSLHEHDTQGQVKWIQENAKRLQQWKLDYGAIYFCGWSLFSNAQGVTQAWRALGLTPCRDPKEVRGPAPLLQQDTSSIIYETLNNPQDSATHLGLHNEGIPGILPLSALFSCLMPAQGGGGEFLLCDGRAILRDLHTDTLARLERKQLRPTFAVLPDWIAISPLLSLLPSWLNADDKNALVASINNVHFQLLSSFTNLTRPTPDFMLDVFPKDTAPTMNCTTEDKSLSLSFSVKLTTHASVPVLHHPITRLPVWWSGMDAGHKGNFYRHNPHLVVNSDCGNADGTDGNAGGKYASETFDVLYGDGGELVDDDLHHVDLAFQQRTRALALKTGDAVLVDNISVLHGRKPFVGKRQHAVVWFLD